MHSLSKCPYFWKQYFWKLLQLLDILASSFCCAVKSHSIIVNSFTLRLLVHQLIIFG